MKSRILLVALPGGVLTFAAAAALTWAADAAPLTQAAGGFPYFALAVAAVLAWRLRSTRLFAANLLFAAAMAALDARWFGADPLVAALCAAFLPPGLLLLAFARDRGFSFAPLRNHVLLALTPITAAAFLSAGSHDRAVQLLTRDFVDPVYTDWSALPQPALLIVVITLAVAALRAAWTAGAAEAALFWLIFATSAAIAAAPLSTARGIWTLGSALIVIVALIEIAYALAFHDELTGLPGRRALNHKLDSLVAPYAIAIADVDHFKSFNDEHGHEVGDQVLRMVAARLRAVGGGGVAYRAGGEEFTIVFANASKRQALEHVEAVREAVANARFALRRLPRPRNRKGRERRGRAGAANDVRQVTISVGVASASERIARVHAVLEAADQAMYRAKNAGRNRVVA